MHVCIEFHHANFLSSPHSHRTPCKQSVKKVFLREGIRETVEWYKKNDFKCKNRMVWMKDEIEVFGVDYERYGISLFSLETHSCYKIKCNFISTMKASKTSGFYLHLYKCFYCANVE